MTKKERKDLFGQLFSTEITLQGAAWYAQHLYKITGEENYRDAVLLIIESLSDIEAQRRKLREAA